MEDVFCEAMPRAIDAGIEKAPTVVSKQFATRNPKTVVAAQRAARSCARRLVELGLASKVLKAK
jgi:hypothetical protein